MTLYYCTKPCTKCLNRNKLASEQHYCVRMIMIHAVLPTSLQSPSRKSSVLRLDLSVQMSKRLKGETESCTQESIRSPSSLISRFYMPQSNPNEIYSEGIFREDIPRSRGGGRQRLSNCLLVYPRRPADA